MVTGAGSSARSPIGRRCLVVVGEGLGGGAGGDGAAVRAVGVGDRQDAVLGQGQQARGLFQRGACRAAGSGTGSITSATGLAASGLTGVWASRSMPRRRSLSV